LDVRATFPAFLRLPVLLVTGVAIILKMTMSLLLLELEMTLSLPLGAGLLNPPLEAENAFPDKRKRRDANNNFNKFFIALFC
jgi:hypothetical protein